MDIPYDGWRSQQEAVLAAMVSRSSLVSGSGSWSGVAYVHDGTVGGSAVLLQSGLHLLTAAHVVESLDVATAEVVFTVSGVTERYRIASIQSYPSASIGATSISDDLALITLEKSAPVSAERYALYTATDEVGHEAAVTGYGQVQDRNGNVIAASGTLHSGYNMIDTTGSALASHGWHGTLADQLFFDYDDGTATHDAFGKLLGLTNRGISGEAMIAPGDSGGGLFIDSNGQWMVAGINSYVSGGQTSDVNTSSDGSVGDVAGATRVSSYAQWIEQAVGMLQSPAGQSTAPPATASVPMTVAEGEGVWFLIQLNMFAKLKASVDFRTADGTATAGLDYIPTSGTMHLAVGERWAKVWVQTLADGVKEGNESFMLVVSNPVNAVFAGGASELSASRTIIDQWPLVGVTTLAPELFG